MEFLLRAVIKTEGLKGKCWSFKQDMQETAQRFRKYNGLNRLGRFMKVQELGVLLADVLTAGVHDMKTIFVPIRHLTLRLAVIGALKIHQRGIDHRGVDCARQNHEAVTPPGIDKLRLSR